MAEEYLSPADVDRLKHARPPALIIDVRSEREFAAGHIPGARHLPRDELADALASLPEDRPLVPY